MNSDLKQKQNKGKRSSEIIGFSNSILPTCCQCRPTYDLFKKFMKQ